MNTSPKAFVLMPFDEEFKSIYDDLIKPALEDAGYEVARADSLLDQQSIMRDIIQGISCADLIVADLSVVNANVFYELGLCHGLRIPTVLITQSLDEVPFDLRPYRVQVYSTRFDQIHELKDALKDIGEKHLRGEIRFGSPIIDFFPANRTSTTADNSFQQERSQQPGIEESAEQMEGEEKGVLDYSAEIERAFDELSRIIVMIGEQNEAIGKKLTVHAERMAELNANPTPGSAGQRQKIGLLVASDMNLCARRFEEELPAFKNWVGILDEAFSGLMEFALNTSIDDREQIIRSREQMASFVQNAKVGTAGMRDYRDVVAGLKGVSKDVNSASRRLSQALDGIVQNMESIEALAVRATALMDQWLESDESNKH
jgi:hypothetical protein